MTKIERAQVFAHKAHDSIDQKRKYTGESYWTHTDAVASVVAKAGGSEDMICAAHLHDIIEDITHLCPTVYNETVIRLKFGDNVANLVVELTDVFTKEKYPTWNRAKRHAEEAKRLATISQDAKLIKICDLINNTESIVAHDPNFARIYLKEKFALLPIFVDCPSELLQRATEQTLNGFKKLGMEIPIFGV